MLIKKMYVYSQNNSGGYFKDIRNWYRDNMAILPVKLYGSYFENKYVSIAVDDTKIVPEENS